MPDPFEYISRSRLEYRHGYRHAYLGDVPALSFMACRAAYASITGLPRGPPVASTLDHIVAAVAG